MQIPSPDFEFPRISLPSLGYSLASRNNDERLEEDALASPHGNLVGFGFCGHSPVIPVIGAKRGGEDLIILRFNPVLVGQKFKASHPGSFWKCYVRNTATYGQRLHARRFYVRTQLKAKKDGGPPVVSSNLASGSPPVSSPDWELLWGSSCVNPHSDRHLCPIHLQSHSRISHRTMIVTNINLCSYASFALKSRRLL
jgi:hypothetical protein